MFRQVLHEEYFNQDGDLTMLNNQTKWDKRFLTLATLVATWSKDPSTQVGAVITKGKHIISLGFNGFPAGVEDSEEALADRDIKYQMILHAEVNAIHAAHTKLEGCTLYTTPFAPCCRCAAQVIQVGIKRIVSLKTPEILAFRWKKELDIASAMYKEAGIDLVIYPQEILNV
jgi:dCMP deaminase